MTLKSCFHIGILIISIVSYSCDAAKSVDSSTTELRAPAYPLITIDPYTSAWSMSDQLYNSPVCHWTGKTHSLIGAIRVDGKVYRFLGKEDIPLEPIIPMAKDSLWQGKYINTPPSEGWEKSEFHAEHWITGVGAFGTPGMKAIGTPWETKEIWVRREFFLPDITANEKLYLVFTHDDDFELYLNGTEVVRTGNKARSEVIQEVDPSLLISGGKNVLAAHCLDRGGLAYVDFGVYKKNAHKEVFSQSAVQQKVSLSATQTHYQFSCGPVNLALDFVSPLLPEDLDLLSRPVNYINYEVASTDGEKHEVQIYFEITPEWAVNDVGQEVEVAKGKEGEVGFVKAGTTEQSVLGKKGDNVRIDWGHVFLAAENDKNTSWGIDTFFEAKHSFIKTGKISGIDGMISQLNREMPAMACVKDLGEISEKSSTGFVMIGYDDIESIQYFEKNLKAWWTKDGEVSFKDVLQNALVEHKSVMKRLSHFDHQLWEEALAAGGKEYADLCVLAYRQSVAAHKLVKDENGNILFLSKENFSNGSIGTVDVTYPSAPLFLRYNTELVKGMLNPIFYYSESGKWTKPFAAHDVGTYPIANGQTYGGDMPVEECGNMIILTAAIAHQEGNAQYAEKHWEILTSWANYLLENGLDPENQLCTDDFAGHFAHNVNLSVKAIMGIACYGRLAEMLGQSEIAEKYSSVAKQMAKEWMKMADDGDHFRLTFDQPGTWSQKYNLVWNKLLGLDIFPDEVARTEVAYYLTKQNKYGLPLDNRRTYTKADWIVWTATLADDKETFKELISPLHDFVIETPDRVPMTDWYETTDATKVGFQARSVVGGYFIKFLEQE
ncbi:glutaminase domain-containing protein [Thermophagus sp. OGC60D27]|uniref:glutaminase domain-containing protein n=1 Tax=Thermophagus sp. OGC60D27 TaxID=3458415 RepID=UPI0040378FE1